MRKTKKKAIKFLLALGLSGFMAKPGLAVTQAQAEQDGQVTWYVAMLPTEARAIADEFMKTYPHIHVTYVVLRANQIPIRVTTEMRAGQANADVVSSSAWDTAALALGHALLKYQPPEAANLVPDAVDKNGYWVGEYVLTLPIVYNSKALADAGLAPPTSIQDLTKPEYKGKFSIEVDDYEWFHVLKQELGQSVLDGLAANSPQFRDGHTTNMNGVIDGEFPISLGVFGYKAYAAQKKGFPVALVNSPPTVAEFQIIGIPKNAPHVNAAEFFENWLISKEAQTFVEQTFQRTPTRNDVPAIVGIFDPAKDHLTYSDPNAAGQYGVYESDFNRTFHVNGQ